MEQRLSRFRFYPARLVVIAIMAPMFMGFSTSDTLNAEQEPITQAVLNDASARWQGPRPCISDKLKSFDGKRIEPKRLSQLANVKLPFRTCGSENLSAMKGNRFLTITAPRIKKDTAAVELDYACPTCGHGAVYTLRKNHGQWRVVARQMVWVS